MLELELNIKALQEGILPAWTGAEVAKLLETCDPEEAYRIKRKFRKMWRKEMKKSLRSASTQNEIKRTVAEFSTPSGRRTAVKNKLRRG